MSIVFNIQRFSVRDEPGIRTNVFINGCPLRCLWCSNPESQNAFTEVAHRDSLCNKCGKCIAFCEVNAVSLNAEGVSIDRKKCTNYGKCIDVCIPKALNFYGKDMSVEEALHSVLLSVTIYRQYSYVILS